MSGPIRPDRAYAVLDHIEAQPDLWRQEIYIGRTECGTVACFAGWTALLFGEGGPEGFARPLSWTAPRVEAAASRWRMPDGTLRSVDSYAEELLGAKTWGLGVDGDESLFAACNSLSDLKRLVADTFGPRPESVIP